MSIAAQVVGSILKHDRKVNSYKLALIRSINDVVLSYPGLADGGADVAVPIRRLAQYWVAYYWPFVNRRSPSFQGPRAVRDGTLTNDMAFRPALTALRELWEDRFGASRPSDGFLLVRLGDGGENREDPLHGPVRGTQGTARGDYEGT